MINKFNLSLGNAENVEQITESNLKAGIRKEDLKDSALQSIFDALDDGNGILEEKEIEKLQTALMEAAAQDGDATNLSKKEAKSLLQTLGLNNLSIDNLFGFLKATKTLSETIDYTTRDIDSPDEIRIKYKEDENGVVETAIYNNDGTLNRTERVKDGNTTILNSAGQITGSTDKNGEKYTRTTNPDGSYTDTYESGRKVYYDKDGKETGGVNSRGISWTTEYNDDGSYTSKWSDGKVQYYDKDGKQTGGKLPNGKTWTNEYNDDGSYTQKWSYGQVDYYDKDGKLTGGKSADGWTYTNEYNKDGSYTIKVSNGRVQYHDKNGKQTGGKLPNGKTWTNEYNDDGSYTQKFSDGEVQYYDKNGKQTGGKLPNGTTWTAEYKDGKLEYREFTPKDGSKYYWGGEDNPEGYAERTANGNIKANPKQGETFNDTMLRLGITDPEDQKIFIKANPKAYKRGYFILADPGKRGGDVYIPKSIADKLDMKDILVDGTNEFNKHKEAKKQKFGL